MTQTIKLSLTTIALGTLLLAITLTEALVGVIESAINRLSKIAIKASNKTDDLRSLTYSLDACYVGFYLWLGNYSLRIGGVEVDDQPYYPYKVPTTIGFGFTLPNHWSWHTPFNEYAIVSVDALLNFNDDVIAITTYWTEPFNRIIIEPHQDKWIIRCANMTLRRDYLGDPWWLHDNSMYVLNEFVCFESYQEAVAWVNLNLDNDSIIHPDRCLTGSPPKPHSNNYLSDLLDRARSLIGNVKFDINKPLPTEDD